MSDDLKRSWFERSLSPMCGTCGESLYQGFARCQKPSAEPSGQRFFGFERVLVSPNTVCDFSGDQTDVQFPNGDGVEELPLP